MPVVSPGEALPDWEQMPDEGPLIFRVRLNPGFEHEAFSCDFDCVWYLLEGSVEVGAETTVSAGEFFCASMNEAYSLRAGSKGAEWLVFSSRSLQPL